MSLKKYMIYDLLMLAVLGAILEGITVWCSFYILNGNLASMVLSVLILYAAIIRWKWWGLTIAPLLALGSFIGGLCLGYEQLTELFPGYVGYFDFRVYLSTLIGLLSIGLLILLIFRKEDFQEKISKPGIAVAYGSLGFVLYEIFKNITYAICQGTNSQFVSTAMFDLFGLVVVIVGVFVLNKQGFLLNVEQKLLDDQKDREEEAKHEKLNIEEK